MLPGIGPGPRTPLEAEPSGAQRPGSAWGPSAACARGGGGVVLPGGYEVRRGEKVFYKGFPRGGPPRGLPEPLCLWLSRRGVRGAGKGAAGSGAGAGGQARWRCPAPGAARLRQSSNTSTCSRVPAARRGRLPHLLSPPGLGVPA